MLLQEIGRFRSDIEDIKPSELKDIIPKNVANSYVGIFWHVGEGRFLIQKAKLLDDVYTTVEMGQDYDDEENPEDIQIDYNRFHKDIWTQEVLSKFKKFKGYKFDYFSRGRILYNVLPKKFGIYVPNDTSFTTTHTVFLAKEFNIPLGEYVVNNRIYKAKEDVKSLPKRGLQAIYI